MLRFQHIEQKSARLNFMNNVSFKSIITIQSVSIIIWENVLVLITIYFVDVWLKSYLIFLFKNCVVLLKILSFQILQWHSF